MKKLLLFILLGLSLSNFAYASDTISDTYVIKYEPGWNLTSGRIDSLRNKISHTYYLHPETKKYFGGRIEEFLGLDSKFRQTFEEIYKIYGTPGSDDRFEYSNSAFMYSTDEASLTLSKQEFLDEKKRWEKSSGVPYLLFKGWNLIQITPAFVFENLSKVTGTCKIEKVSSYNAKKQSWETYSIDTLIPPELAFGGLAVKVTDNCQFDFRKLIK